MSQDFIRSFRERCDAADDFVIVTHINPDGDAVGSEYALARFLLERGKTVRIVNQDPVPDYLGFIDFADPQVELYDPKPGKWAPAAALSTARGLAATTRLRDGRIVLVGGAAGTIDKPVPVAACEAFDSTTGKWATLAKLPSGRVAGTLIHQQADGLALIGGGSGASAQSVRSWIFLIP